MMMDDNRCVVGAHVTGQFHECVLLSMRMQPRQAENLRHLNAPPWTDEHHCCHRVALSWFSAVLEAISQPPPTRVIKNHRARRIPGVTSGAVIALFSMEPPAAAGAAASQSPRIGFKRECGIAECAGAGGSVVRLAPAAPSACSLNCSSDADRVHVLSTGQGPASAPDWSYDRR